MTKDLKKVKGLNESRARDRQNVEKGKDMMMTHSLMASCRVKRSYRAVVKYLNVNYAISSRIC